VGSAPVYCFSQESNSDVIIENLVVAHLELQQYGEVLDLIPLVTDKRSIFYSERGYDNFARKVGQFYQENPRADKPPPLICQKFLTDEGKNLRADTVFYALGPMGCRAEKVSIAKKMEQNLNESEKRGTRYKELRAVLGKGDEVLLEISLLENLNERFRQYLGMARFFHSNGYPELSELALKRSISTYNELKEERLSSGRILELYATLVALEKDKENNEVYKEIETEAQKAALHDDLNYEINKIKVLISENDFKGVDAGYKKFHPEDLERADLELFPYLVNSPSKGKLFEKLWPNRMKYCLKSSIVTTKTTVASILVPICINHIMSLKSGPTPTLIE
jgi:hypothetical protein